MKKLLTLLFAVALTLSLSSFSIAQDAAAQGGDKKTDTKDKKKKKEKKEKKAKKDEKKSDMK